MPLEIIRDDITKVRTDAIVNAANTSLLGGGGVDGAIHHAAGPELLAECRTLGGCEVGQAKITKGYRLPARYVIHTVGPVWQGGGSNEEKLLTDCYRNSLLLAEQYRLESVAFPLISAGAFGYPRDKALSAAISVIGDFLLSSDMTVYLVVFDKASFMLSEKLFSSIAQYIDERYVEEHTFPRNRSLEKERCLLHDITASDVERAIFDKQMTFSVEEPDACEPAVLKKCLRRSLEDVVGQLEETFSQRLLRLIDEKGLTDAETYKRANIDRKLFSKIRNDIYYKPSKPTVIAFAIALGLNLDETGDLLLKAGFALSHSSKFDIIVQYFIEEGNYNIFEINEALFAFDQNLLGA